MIRTFAATAATILTSTAAIAHPGHIDPVAGHSHEGLVIAAVAALIVLAMGIVLRSGVFRKDR